MPDTKITFREAVFSREDFIANSVGHLFHASPTGGSGRRFALRTVLLLTLLLGIGLLIEASGIARVDARPAHLLGPCQVIIPGPNAGDGNNFVTSIVALAPNDVWMVGYYEQANTLRSLTMHWNGSSWTDVASPNPDVDFNTLFAVDAVSSNDISGHG